MRSWKNGKGEIELAKLAPKDSNLDKQIQSLLCYHYTRGQMLQKR